MAPQAIRLNVRVTERRPLTKEELADAARLKALWTAYKRKHGMTQAKAGAEMGMSQSAVGQYLNGIIALNTDAILSFALLLDAQPHEIRPSMGAHSLTALEIEREALKLPPADQARILRRLADALAEAQEPDS